ncbi:MAG: hypothetical protein HFF17_06685 [Oscillospiraceae bacterium]|nr:hypothetical protein [Oscillospiraceae bacterium]
MKIIQQQPNPSGAYPPIQEGSFSAVPPGMALWPDDLPAEAFYEAQGFVRLTVEEVEDVPTVTACAPDTAAWEAWRASLPPEEPAPPSEAEQLRADVDYIAAMTGVSL